jgi:hypothetical protein
MSLLSRIAGLFRRFPELDIKTAAGRDLDRLAGLKERPAGMTDATLRSLAIADEPAPCVICGQMANPPFWVERPLPFHGIERGGPYCFPHWPGRAY